MDKIAHQFDVAHHLKLIPFKGIYKKLNKNLAKKVNHHIYPVPDLENPFFRGSLYQVYFRGCVCWPNRDPCIWRRKLRYI